MGKDFITMDGNEVTLCPATLFITIWDIAATKYMKPKYHTSIPAQPNIYAPCLGKGKNNMNANTFNSIIKYSDSLTPDEQLRLATILIEKVCQTQITIHHSVWQNLHRLVSSLFLEKKAPTKILPTHQEADNQPANRWRAFFKSTPLPTEDFMQERVDLPPQTRELF
jgi:hypothetical protein